MDQNSGPPTGKFKFRPNFIPIWTDSYSVRSGDNFQVTHLSPKIVGGPRGHMTEYIAGEGQRISDIFSMKKSFLFIYLIKSNYFQIRKIKKKSNFYSEFRN